MSQKKLIGYPLLGMFAALLWPFVTFILLIPQRLPESIDETRPL